MYTYLHVEQRLDADRAIIEKRKQDRQDLHLYNKVAIITDKTFNNYQGFDLAVFDERNLEVSPSVDVMKVLKTDRLFNFKKALADHYSLQQENVRLWSILYRQNKTVRVDHVLTGNDDRQSNSHMHAYFVSQTDIYYSY